MKIALYISPAHTVPPNSQFILAPWYLIGDIANHLCCDPDFEVTLFASQGSRVRSKLYDFGIPATSLVKKDMAPPDYKKRVREAEEKLFTQMIAVVKEESIDIVHIHQPIEPLYPLVSEARKISPKTKFVFTLHDPVSPERAEALNKFVSLGQCYFISISLSQFKNSGLSAAATVYNGVDLNYFKFNPLGGDQFLTAGRIVPEKGYTDAISAIKKVEGASLLITGQLLTSSPKSVDYFNSAISLSRTDFISLLS